MMAPFSWEWAENKPNQNPTIGDIVWFFENNKPDGQNLITIDW